MNSPMENAMVSLFKKHTSTHTPPTQSTHMTTMTTPTVIDLFCGIGGMTHGFVKEGFEVVAGIDNDETCRYAYESNNNSARFLLQGIEDVTGETLLSFYSQNDIKILVGCAPCQPFSKYSQGKPLSSKWSLLKEFGRLIESIQPDIVSMENVPGLVKHEIYDEFVALLKDNDYHTSKNIVYCPDYGIPQKRTRLVFLASKKGPIKLIDKTHTPDNYKTVRETIEVLPKIADGQTHREDRLHRAAELSELNKKRIRSTPEGGSWKDWNESLILDCHKKDSGKSYGSVYGRMKWDEPAPTMTTHCIGYGNGRFGHPEQNRAISFREAALFQTFPTSYKMFDSSESSPLKNLARHIGNAVPVELGQIIAKSIQKHLVEYYGE